MRPITFKSGNEAVLPLPTSFIDKYMTECTPVYALIYIYGLRQSMEKGQNMSTQEMGEVFHILETDVLNAWKYWDTQGLVKMDTKGEALSIEFLSVPENNVIDNKPKTAETVTASLELRPQYTVEELSFYRDQSMDIARLFSHGEQTLGKLLTYHDLNVLFGFYDWLRLPIDVILYLLTYCSDNGHRDLRYVEKAAMDWAERGINTVEEAREYTDTFDGEYRAIMKALGHPSAFPSPSQKKYMQKWLAEMPLELILEACDKTAAQIGKPKLQYIDKIIGDWKKNNINTIEEAEAADEEWKKTKKDERARRLEIVDNNEKHEKRRNRFANFKPRERDFAQIERLEQEYLIKSVEG